MCYHPLPSASLFLTLNRSFLHSYYTRTKTLILTLPANECDAPTKEINQIQILSL